jgi:hypothetical protein
MGWSVHHRNGLIHYTPKHSYRGYTLFTNQRGTQTNLIDMEGQICHRWQADEGITYSYLLPNGNLLLRTNPAEQAGGTEHLGGARTVLAGASTALLELDWESNIVWEYRSPDMYLHHDFERLPNGNTLILLWTPIPNELAAQVKGGFGDTGVMFGDVVQEVTPEGTIVYQWNSWENLDIETDVICHLEGRREWTHQNALNVTPDGDLLVSFRQTSTVGIVNKESGEFTWKWGPGEISHQHCPTFLENGHVLLFDNGPHRPGVSYSRIVEVDPATNEVAWEYKGDPPISFYSYQISGTQRLPNGNTLICEGGAGRIFEVTPNNEIVWEYVNPFLAQSGAVLGATPTSYANSVFRAHRYGPDYPGLRGKDLDPARYANINRLHLVG